MSPFSYTQTRFVALYRRLFDHKLRAARLDHERKGGRILEDEKRRIGYTTYKDLESHSYRSCAPEEEACILMMVMQMRCDHASAHYGGMDSGHMTWLRGMYRRFREISPRLDWKSHPYLRYVRRGCAESVTRENERTFDVQEKWRQWSSSADAEVAAGLYPLVDHVHAENAYKEHVHAVRRWKLAGVCASTYDAYPMQRCTRLHMYVTLLRLWLDATPKWFLRFWADDDCIDEVRQLYNLDDSRREPTSKHARARVMNAACQQSMAFDDSLYPSDLRTDPDLLSSCSSSSSSPTSFASSSRLTRVDSE